MVKNLVVKSELSSAKGRVSDRCSGHRGSGRRLALMMLDGFRDSNLMAIFGLERPKTRSDMPRRTNAALAWCSRNYGLFPPIDKWGKPSRFRCKSQEMRQGPWQKQKVMRATGYGPDGQLCPDAVRLSSLVFSQQADRLARALVFEPELVLMDEPLAALDKQLRETLQFEITNLAHSKLWHHRWSNVTHDQTEALTMSDRASPCLKMAGIPTVGPRGTCMKKPQEQLVAQFIGENTRWQALLRKSKVTPACEKLDRRRSDSTRFP